MGPMGMGPMGAGGGAQMGPMPGLTSGEGGNFHLGPGGQWTGEGGDNGKHQPGMRRHSGFLQPIRHLSGRTNKSLFWKQSGLSHVVRKNVRNRSLSFIDLLETYQAMHWFCQRFLAASDFMLNCLLMSTKPFLKSHHMTL